MQRGNQHGGREYDDLQNLFDTTSHEIPLDTVQVIEKKYPWCLDTNIQRVRILGQISHFFTCLFRTPWYQALYGDNQGLQGPF